MPFLRWVTESWEADNYNNRNVEMVVERQAKLFRDMAIFGWGKASWGMLS